MISDKNFLNINNVIVLTILLCIGVNLLFGNTIVISLVNGIILGGFLKISNYYVSAPKQFLPFLAFIPLFSYGQLNAVVILLEISILILLFTQRKVVFKKTFLVFPILISLLTIISGLISVKIISSDFTINWERSIYPQHLYELEINRQQNEALYLPYRLRPIVFSGMNAYFYVLVRNAFKFLSIDNLHRGFLLVNIVFLGIGLVKFKEFSLELKWIFIGIFISILLISGVPKMPDTLSTLLVFRGFFVILILKGLSSFQIKTTNYVIFWLLSLLIFNSLSI